MPNPAIRKVTAVGKSYSHERGIPFNVYFVIPHPVNIEV